MWIAGAVAVLLAGCQPTMASLADEAAARLEAPNSELAAAGGHDASTSIAGDLSAITRRAYGTNEKWETVAAYFRDKLVAAGWVDGGCSSGIRATTEYEVMAWHTDDRILRLGHRRSAPTHAAPMYATWYEVALIGHGPPPDCAKFYSDNP